MSPRHRIGIACYPTYGGSGVVATELGLALSARNHEVHLFSYARPSRLPTFHPGLHFHGVSVSSYPLFEFPPYDLALASALRETLDQEGLDIIHAHYAVPHALCAYMATQMSSGPRARIVTTLHGTDITILGRDPSYREVIRFGLEQSDAVVCVSQWLADQTRAVFDYSGEIEVIPNFVDHQRFRPDLGETVRQELHAEGRPLLVHASNFRSLKRPKDTLSVLECVAEKTGALLVLIGDGPELESVRTSARQKGLSKNVHFFGEIDDVAPIFSAADVALFPSESESFGLAALEASACGTPVVATAVGGVPEVILDGETGFLHPVGDTAGMAESVIRLLENPHTSKAFSDAGIKRAKEEFSLARVLQVHEDLYSSLVESSS